jgi:hypothetical protein
MKQTERAGSLQAEFLTLLNGLVYYSIVIYLFVTRIHANGHILTQRLFDTQALISKPSKQVYNNDSCT